MYFLKFKTGKTNVSDRSQNTGYLGKIMTGMGHEGSFWGIRNILVLFLFLGGNYTIMFTL